MATLPNISPEIIQAYQDEIAKTASVATAKRKSISLNRFFDWAAGQGHIQENPLAQKQISKSANEQIANNPTGQIVRIKKNVGVRTFAVIGMTTGMMILLFLLVFKLKLPIPFITNFAQEASLQTNPAQNILSQNQASQSGSIPALSAVNGAWNLYAKLKLTDKSGQAQVGSETLNFKLYDSAKDGTAVYTSQPQTITTDSNGSALISLDDVPTDLFFKNNTLYLEPQVGSMSASARIPVSTASTPSNIGGFFPSDPATGAINNTVPIINSDGTLLLASESPAIKAKQGNFLLEGQAVTIKTADGSDGNIEINPDGKGYAHFLFEGNKGNFLNAQGPNLTSGSLYYGMVPNNATGYDLIRLQSGAPKMTTKFSVDAVGNTYIAGDLNVIHDIATNGVDRLTSAGALTNITGYSQNSGNFTINQNAGDTASITKNTTALSDVLTLTLNEDMIPGSHYSSLVLNRLGGDDNSRALLVNSGNAQFNGQVELGRFTANPVAIGDGSLIYNSTDNLVYFWNGTAWVSMGSGSGSSAFSAITSGTNTTATMIVGSGASLSFTGTGTITASDVTCAGCVSNSELANSSITFAGDSGSTAISLGGTENIVGAGNITTSQSGNTLTITGTTTIAPDSLDFSDFKDAMTLDASTNIATSGFTLSTSGTGALNFGSTGQVTFAGNVDATNGLDVTNANLTVGGANFSVTPATGNVTTAGDVAVNGGDLTTTQTTANLFTNATTLGIGAGTGTTTINNDLAITGSTGITENGNGAGIVFNGTGNHNIQATSGTLRINAHTLTGTITGNNQDITGIGNLTVNGNTTLGDSAADTVTFNGNVNSDILPATTNTYDLGSNALRWDNVYANAFFQNGNPVCDSSGANCPPSGVNYWSLANGALYPSNNSVDLLIGSSATTSAKFAFINVSAGIPTASISGTTANVATYLTGEGTLSTTNAADLTIGSATTGNVIINSRGTTALTANGANLTAAGNLTVQGTTGITESGAGAGLTFSGTGTHAIANSSAGTTLTIDAATTGQVQIAGISTGDILFGGGSGSTGCTITNSTGDLACSGDVAVNGGDLTTTQTTANLFTNATTLGIGAGSGTTTINNGLTVVGNTNLNGNTTLGNATGDTITFTGRVNSNILPSVTATDDLGSPALQWNNVYAVSFVQNGFNVCDSSGLNCPAGAGYWSQTLGALYPTNNTVDLLIGATSGATATQSAKFAFTGVSGGTPTASIAGSITDVATYLTGNGNLSTTNAQDLTLGSSTTGNVIINSRGSTALTANGANLTAAGNLTVQGTTGITESGAGAGLTFSGTGTHTISNSSANTALTVQSNGSGTLTLEGGSTGLVTIAGTSTGGVNIGDSGTGDINLAGGSASTGCTVTNSSGNLACTGDLAVNGGDITTTSTTATLFNTNATTLNIGGGATTITNIGPAGDVATGTMTFGGGSGDTGCTLDNTTGNFTCSGIITGAAATSKWNAITNPDGDLTLTMANFNTTFNWDPGADSAETNFSLTTQGEDTTAGGDENQVLLALSQTSNGVNVDQAADALLTLTNNDANDPVVNAIRFDAGAAGTDFTYGINFDAASIGTAELLLQNGETIDNVTDGTVLITSPITSLSGDLTVTGNDITFGNAETISNATDGTVLITSPTTQTSGNLTVAGTSGLNLSGTGGDITFANGEKIDNDTDNQININIGSSGTLLLTSSTTATLTNSAGALAINAQATGLNLQADGTINVNLAGGSGATGCTVTNSTGALTCTGSITSTATSGTQGWWQLNGTDLSPTSATYNLAIGGTTSASPFYVTAANGNLVTSGSVAAGGVGQFGGTTTAAYSRFGTAAATHTGSVTAANDVLISSDLELDGILYLDGENISDSAGVATITFAVDPSAFGSYNVAANGSWLVENTVNPGMAALMVNQTKAGDIFTASQSGTPVFTVAHVTGTAANGFTLTGSAAGSGVAMAATGTDTNIALSIDAKGAGALNLNNTGTGDVLIAGGSLVTGCTVTNSSGALSCSGDITTTATGTPSVGFWTRNTASGFLYPSTITDSVGIGDATPDARFDIDAATTTTAAFGLTDTGVHTGTGTNSIFNLVANSATTGDIINLSGTGLTTGEVINLDATYAPTNGSTNEALDLNITHTPTGSADNFSSIDLTTTDGTALDNTIYGINNTLTLTGNANKTARGIYSTVTTSSTTADDNRAGQFNTSATGAISTGTRSNYGVVTAPATSGANSGGTTNIYGVYSSPTSTGSTTGSTVNVYGNYMLTTGTLTTGGTINQYGAYVANAVGSTTGTSTKTGLYLEDFGATSLADNNYAICLDCDGTYNTSSAVNGITWGSDANSVNLYRSASDTLKTDDSLSVNTSLITASTSFDLLNTTATTINFAGATTTLNIGTGTAGDTINIGTGAATNSIVIGNNTGGTAITNTVGTGAFAVNSSRTAASAMTLTTAASTNQSGALNMLSVNAANLTNSAGDQLRGLILTAPTSATNNGNNLGIVISGTNWNTDITLQNNETIDNEVNGTIAFGVTNVDINGQLIVNLDTAGSSTEAVCGNTTTEGATNVTIDDCTTSVNPDYAEMYPAETDVEYGDVVSIGPNNITYNHMNVDENGQVVSEGQYTVPKIIKTSTAYDKNILGIVSNNWSDFSSTGKLSIPDNENPKPIALSGRVPVKIDPDSPAIAVGDYVTSSDKPGFAIKAEHEGSVVAKALESWQPNTGTEKIIVFLQLGYHDPNLALTNTGDLNIAQESNGNYQLTNNTNNTLIDRIGAFGKLVAANIKSGFVTAEKIVTPKIQVALISPLADGTDVTVQIGSEATPSGKFAIDNAQGTEVASIDNQGNASFSGVVHSQNIDDIQALLTNVAADQSVLADIVNSGNFSATNSANLSQIATEDLYVTNQAAINSLSITQSLTLGSDFAIDANGINTLSSPLKLQSLASAPIELMAGLVTIDTHGNVNIAGDLYVAGVIKSNGYQLATNDLNGAPLAQIDTSGSALFNSVSTGNLIIGAADATESGTISNGEINTNSTIGKVTIPAGTSEITINNPKVTDYTLVYVTPTSSTQNNVLYVKSKQNGSFVVGFDQPLSVNVNFNWWIVQVQ